MTRLLRPEHNGLRVFVYFNLHKCCWSVKALEGDSKGKVIGHASRLVLTDCVFKVSEAGRQRVLREKRKNVHAGVQGTMNTFTMLPIEMGEPVRYDPYTHHTFVTFNEEYVPVPIYNATLVTLDTQTGVLAYGVK